MTDVDKLKCPSKGKIPLSPFSPPAHSFALLRFSDRSMEKEREKDGWKIEKRLGREEGRGEGKIGRCCFEAEAVAPGERKRKKMYVSGGDSEEGRRRGRGTKRHTRR